MTQVACIVFADLGDYVAPQQLPVRGAANLHLWTKVEQTNERCLLNIRRAYGRNLDMLARGRARGRRNGQCRTGSIMSDPFPFAIPLFTCASAWCASISFTSVAECANLWQRCNVRQCSRCVPVSLLIPCTRNKRVGRVC